MRSFFVLMHLVVSSFDSRSKTYIGLLATEHRAQSLKPQRLNGGVGWEMVRALRLKQFCGRNGIRQRMVR
ncbi:hypothetical protein VCSRO187_0095 [Vibrio cholerae]|nr:hypothetical protein VCSRO187_0095 [Vibrio cholerae]